MFDEFEILQQLHKTTKAGVDYYLQDYEMTPAGRKGNSERLAKKSRVAFDAEIERLTLIEYAKKAQLHESWIGDADQNSLTGSIGLINSIDPSKLCSAVKANGEIRRALYDVLKTQMLGDDYSDIMDDAFNDQNRDSLVQIDRRLAELGGYSQDFERQVEIMLQPRDETEIRRDHNIADYADSVFESQK